MGLLVTTYKRQSDGFYSGTILNVNTGEKSEFTDAYKLILSNNNLNKYVPVYNPKNMDGYAYNPNEETYYFLIFKKNDSVYNELILKLIYYYETQHNPEETFEIKKEIIDGINVPDNWCPIIDPQLKNRNCSQLQLLLKHSMKFVNDNSRMIGVLLLILILYILYTRY